MKYAWIERNRRHWPISLACEVLGVSPSGYHERKAREIGTLAAYWAQSPGAANDSKFGHGVPDFNNIKISCLLLPGIIGEEVGEPSELVGKVFTVRKLGRPE